MAAPTNHYKIGLFVITGFAAAMVALAITGALSAHKQTVQYHSYFNESVQGLELGSGVKFRGVTIGHVAAIEVAKDHRHVDVVSDLDVTDLSRLGLLELGRGRLQKPKFAMPDDLRAQLGSQGITGVKFVAVDFFDVKANPPPPLPFEPAERYIPATNSMMKNLEDSITTAMERLPVMVDAVVMIMGRVDRLLATLEKEDVSHKAGIAIEHVNEVLAALKSTVTRLDRANLGDKAAATLDDLHAAVARTNVILERFSSDKGMLPSVERATASFAEIGRNGVATGRDVDKTLRDVSEAADAIRKLVEALERDPDMLIKGKASPRGTR